jgi:DNA polymerase
MKRVVVDLESRSRADLESCGTSVYARHPTTEVRCMAYAIDGGEKHVWLPGDEVPEVFRDPDAIFIAHGAAFEIYMHRFQLVAKFGFPPIPTERWECSAARAGFARLPQKLSRLSTFLDLGDFGKDAAGHQNMMQLCRPQVATLIEGIYHGGHFDDNFVKHEWNIDYCKQDVVAEERVCQLTPELPERERRIWLLHRKINERGVPVDLELCRGAVTILDRFRLDSCRRLESITDGALTTPDEDEKLKSFLKSRGVDLPQVKNSKGEDRDSLDADAVEFLLVKGVEDDVCREVLTIRKQLAASAIDKYYSALVSADSDGRCREGFKYYGAGPGRWSGNGTQFQNLRRPRKKWPAECLAAITSGDYSLVHELSCGDVFSCLADHVRSIITAPPGRVLVISDFAAIEARMLRWLISDEEGLEVYRRFDAGDGHEPYVMQASKIFGLAPDELADSTTKKARAEHKDKRQIGKVAELQLGYGAAWEKFKDTVFKWTGIVIDEGFARDVVGGYRSGNPLVPAHWRNLEMAAVQAVKTRREVHCDRVAFRIWKDWLLCRLPSGRDLYYFKPEIGDNKFGNPSVWYLSDRGRKNLYGGLLTENIDQGSSRDKHCDSMLQMDARGVFITMHCHDEVVPEVREGDERAERIVHEAMETVESWAEGLPVKAETHSSRRYTK